ncbi:hypothetical protein ZIOFF_055881 [Zingiber officinale]|uniref:Uncharacterized protein n=1 Tax=Zingiber officinale TaxID=94328 RepID=A0A8J5KSJ3_ZINOF|nr:hypothetical protein ZIOFF_055881 [Zingiber officinale]
MRQMMEGTSGCSAPAWWSLNASMALPQPSNSEMWQQDHDHGGQDLPESWCRLLLGGFIIGEEDQKHGLIKWTDQSNNCGVEPFGAKGGNRPPQRPPAPGPTGFHDQHHQAQSHGPSSWTQNSTVLQASSPGSCVTTSLSTHSMLDFSAKRRHKLPADHNNSSEGNSTEAAPTLKKARVQGSSSPQSSLKVRKEKLGDRITALHQLVSPFGKDLKSRGLCLVPVSFTMHVGGDDGADFWAPSLAGGF